jgi:hypothetical protein
MMRVSVHHRRKDREQSLGFLDLKGFVSANMI